MAKLVWLGEPESNNEGPRRNIWNGITFPRGEVVEVNNEHMIAKARRNPSFSVDGQAYVPDGSEPHPNAAGPRVPSKTDLSEMTVAELRAEAARRGVDVEDLGKVEIREKLAQSE
jgi:hypothetical protein